MKNRIFNISAACLSLSFLFVPYKQADSSTDNILTVGTTINIPSTSNHSFVHKSTETISEVSAIYDSINLAKSGLKKEVFEYAVKGYLALSEENKINRSGIITICDFSQSSRRKRMYVVDIANYKLLMQTHVAHGRNSGREYATRFSNKPESLQSSLGFYATGEIYNGKHGKALKLDGLEKGVNSNARSRAVVIHGANYVSDTFIKNNHRLGRSLGCPAIPEELTDEIINTIKNKSCLFIYHPSRSFKLSSELVS